MQRLLGVLGKARADLNEHLLVSLYNRLVLPHLQYCLMVLGNFEKDRNKAQGETKLKLQKRFVGLIARKSSRYHADPLFAKYGILKVVDLYQQQLRLHAWKFHNDQLPYSQLAMLARVEESHSYGTWAARSGFVVSTGDRRLVGYRIPTQCGTLTAEHRVIMSVASFKRSSRGDFLVQYGTFQCGVRGCWVCGRCLLRCHCVGCVVSVCCCCHVGCVLPIAGGVLVILVLVYCCCLVGYLLPIAGGDWR
jgi:hypothetical protein